MILKSLLLQGFKSFPDKTEIRFLGGMTAIVGPNGSGKSNISDAIRWVLGEQSSRSLRGAKMEDVIFGGTQKRGPVGFAEVSLILDNSEGVFRSEHTEIMVTRRYYRSGESEYYLNKKHCRLKDIHELFMDTGLGRDGYSIIGQGRIDEILSLKSEDRREIFEEAAGVTKFRYRKEEAERKLAATEDNLVRIRDLYSELENQAGPLAAQAEKAKQYLLLRDELRVIEVSLWLRELNALRIGTQKTEADQKICTDQLDAAREQLEALYRRSEALAEQMHQADAQTDSLRRALREHEQSTAELQSRCAVLRANIQNDQENIERTRRDSTRQAEQAEALARQQADRRSHCAALDEAYTGLQQGIAEAEAHAAEWKEQRAQHVQARETLREQIEVQNAANFQTELAQTAAQAGLDGMDSRRDTIGSDIERTAGQLEAEQRVHDGYQAKLDVCRQTLGGVKNKLAGIALKADSRRERAAACEKTLAAHKSGLNDCENRIRMLREMQKEYEGFSRAVKLVMKRAASGAQHGVRGPVSSLLNVEERYVTAIETALGAAASNIVVETAQDAKAAIEFLKRSDSGRATFLPMDTIKPASLREQGLEAMAGCHGTADKLVTCADEYRAIVQSLLARTVVADHLDAALAIARAYHHRFRIVTLDGQVIQAGGAMTGGSVSKTTGALARAGTLRELETKRNTLLRQVEEVERALSAAKEEAAALEYERKVIEAERAQAQEEQARLTAMLAQHSALLESVRQRHDALTLERDNLAEAKAEYERTIAEKGEALRQGQAKVKALETERAARDAALAGLDETLTENAAQIVSLRTAAAENRTEAAAERRALDDLERLRSEMERSLSGAGQTLRAFEESIAANTAALETAEASLRDSGSEAERLRSEITAASQQRMQLESDKTAADKQTQAQNEEILGLEREKSRLAAQLEQQKERETQILTKMWESYELTPTPAAQVAVDLPDTAAAEQRAGELRGQMRALGNVNLDAVDEYSALMERFTFLGEQKTDLETAQRELYKVIEQLTVNMKEIFASEFAKLNAFFGQTFREIFGGGHAALQLADTSDILNCGIDILVSLPGKAVKTITLLSGGEKAFVAIALYFAILKLRPTPFSVLDEIEAALDDVNVTRFAEYVKRLSDKTQFVVITHRRGTMEAADMLYGVTMQEQGVSRMLMLNLAEAEKHISNNE
ncbi:MAG: chromosome segregation protein SMC [Butyricicoccus sp.]